MKTIWKGSISFGLVNIPIQLYSATKSQSISFKLLHEECLTPVKNKRWCSTCDKEVRWDETVKGYELPDGTYFVIEQEELNQLKSSTTDTIDIFEFIDRDKIDSIYLDNHYYVMPNKKTDKAFFLFIAALKKLKKVAIGKFVMRDKEYIAMIEPYKNGILLNTLNYQYEIRDFKALEDLKAPKEISKPELDLAMELIKRLSKDKLDISKYKDNFAIKLKERIEKVAKGIKIPEVQETQPTKEPVPSLEEALRASLEMEQPRAK